MQRDNTHQIEPSQPFFVDSRPLGKYDPGTNYGEPECDRYYADPVTPAEITWAAHSDEPGIVTTIAYSPVTGEALGVVAIMPDGAVRASRACAGGVLATEAAVALLRGEGDPWATSVYWEADPFGDEPYERQAGSIYVLQGVEAFLAAAQGSPREAVIGVMRVDASVRAMLRRVLPEGWGLVCDASVVEAVLS